MGYHEVAVPPPRPTIVIAGESYDVDYFGMDDGRSEEPDAALRLLFQLGSGLMIYLYVIQAGGASDLKHFAHNFWLKDCAVAYVEMEERGPPASVHAGTMTLPRVYGSVELSGPPPLGERSFSIESQEFRAREAPSGEQELEMTFVLGDGGRPAGALRWTRRDAWTIDLGGGARRALGPDERIRFGRPL